MAVRHPPLPTISISHGYHDRKQTPAAVLSLAQIGLVVVVSFT
jgi:hypothetical protein